jgi:hypothetical protein
MRDAALPVTLIVIGLGWLAWHYGWLPDPDWIIAGGLVVAGIAVVVFDGVTKSSVVAGPLLIGAGVAWGLHAERRFPWSVLVACLLVLLGVLLLVARHPRIPERPGRTRAPPPLP